MSANPLSVVRRVAGELAIALVPRVALRKRRKQYDRVAKNTRAHRIQFLNYGYAVVNESEPEPPLEPDHEPYRFPAQLYHHVCTQVSPLKDLDVLEVSSGQGAGALYMKHYLGARTVTGLDLSPGNVAKSRESFPLDGVSFHQGNAERMPFEEATFDAVVNVEASHLYPHPARFLRETFRVLRPGGCLLLTDLGPRSRVTNVRRFCHEIAQVLRGEQSMMLTDLVPRRPIGRLERALRRSGLQWLKETDLTANVQESLLRRSGTVRYHVRRMARTDDEYVFWVKWSRVEGTYGYELLAQRKELYKAYALRKPPA